MSVSGVSNAVWYQPVMDAVCPNEPNESDASPVVRNWFVQYADSATVNQTDIACESRNLMRLVYKNLEAPSIDQKIKAVFQKNIMQWQESNDPEASLMNFLQFERSNSEKWKTAPLVQFSTHGVFNKALLVVFIRHASEEVCASIKEKLARLPVEYTTALQKELCGLCGQDQGLRDKVVQLFPVLSAASSAPAAAPLVDSSAPAAASSKLMKLIHMVTEWVNDFCVRIQGASTESQVNAAFADLGKKLEDNKSVWSDVSALEAIKEQSFVSDDLAARHAAILAAIAAFSGLGSDVVGIAECKQLLQEIVVYKGVFQKTYAHVASNQEDTSISGKVAEFNRLCQNLQTLADAYPKDSMFATFCNACAKAYHRVAGSCGQGKPLEEAV